MKDFMYAALPWILLGLAVAVILTVKPFSRKDKETACDCRTEGMCIGMCLGCAIGAAGVMNIGTGLSLGVLIGMCVGMRIKKDTGTEE